MFSQMVTNTLVSLSTKKGMERVHILGKMVK